MFADLLAALTFLRFPEVCALINDLGLDFPDSIACRNMRDDLVRQRDPLYGKDFEKERAEFKSQRYPNLLDFYARHNSKGKKRSFGCSDVKDLSLF